MERRAIIQQVLYCAIMLPSFLGNVASMQASQPLPQSFDEFVIVLVPAESQEPFRHYYLKKIDQMKVQRSSAAKKRQLAQLKKRAYYALEVHHPKWAREVAPALEVHNDSVQDTVSDDVRVSNNFLMQYGIYLTYVRETATRKGSLWTKVQTKKDAVHHKMTAWVDAVRQQKNSFQERRKQARS